MNTACQCTDPGCPVHSELNVCRHRATQVLYRVDMDDATGTPMCTRCADDAYSSGVFTEEKP